MKKELSQESITVIEETDNFEMQRQCDTDTDEIDSSCLVPMFG